MPRRQSARSASNSRSRRTNDAAITIAAYSRDPRWATPAARRRTDVYVVDITDRLVHRSSSSEVPLALSA